jgi:hypothetical protein
VVAGFDPRMLSYALGSAFVLFPHLQDISSMLLPRLNLPKFVSILDTLKHPYHS